MVYNILIIFSINLALDLVQTFLYNTRSGFDIASSSCTDHTDWFVACVI